MSHLTLRHYQTSMAYIGRNLSKNTASTREPVEPAVQEARQRIRFMIKEFVHGGI